MIRDEKRDGETGKGGAGGSHFSEKEGGFTPCLEISLLRPQDLLEGDLPGPISFSATGGCKVWNGMGEAELIALNF